jgi:autotransporter-associated beta strand protein
VGLGSATFNGISYGDVPNSYTRLDEPSNPSQAVDLCVFQLQSNPVGLDQLTVSSTEPANNSQIVAIGYGANRATSETYWDSNWNVVSSSVLGGYAGYYWASGNTKRWGTSNITQRYGKSVDDGYGVTDVWETTFSTGGGSNAMQAAVGDSGGGVFYKSGSAWELTGLTLAIGQYVGQPGNAAVFGNVTYFADLSMYSGEIAQVMAQPEPLFWSGSNTWDQGITANWSRVSGGPYNQIWNAGMGAVFEGTAGIVTVANTGVNSVNSITFNTDGYTLTGTGAITLNGTGGNIATGAGTDTINCPVAGSVGLTKNGAGTLILSGMNTYTGDTTINAGTLQVGNGGTTGNISGNVNNNGILAFNRSDTVTFGGNISGGGQLLQQGPGTTILTGTATHIGGTTINAGTLQIGNGGTTGSVAGDIANYGALVFNRSDAVVVAGAISGNGSVTQQGSGRVILAGDVSYTGVTNVQNGALQVNNVTSAMITYCGGVNVTGGFLVLDYSASGISVASTVQGVLQTAYSHGFTNTADQIYDTAATSSVGLGWVDNATTHQVTVMPALYGDANLSGQVTAADLGILLANFNGTGTYNWSQGDFNYDGKVTAADLGKLLANFNHTGPLNINLAPSVTLDSTELAMLASHGITVSTVPEPSILVMLVSLATSAFGMLAYARRRRAA